MPYTTIGDLPPEVTNSLTAEEQQRWLAVFNAVFEQTEDEEKAFMAAWGAVRKSRTVAGRAVTLDDSSAVVVIKGWGLLFTGPDAPDFYGTHFSTMTHLLADFYKDAPLWMEHGLDADYSWEPIGRRHKIEIYGYGVWAEHTLFPDHPLYARTVQLTRDGQLSYSSDSIAHYVAPWENPASGELRVWPLAGWSLTQHPAEPGLGPITLDGLEATIREVVAAEKRSFPVAGGRAVVTVTACKAVYHPQEGPLAPADSPPDDSQAREAREPEGHIVSSIISLRGETMDPETLAALAEFLGVDATPEAVHEALVTLITQLEGGGQEESVEEPATEMAIDADALRGALDLAEDAGVDEIVTVLQVMRTTLEAPEGAHGLDYEALRRARRSFDDWADRTPATHPLPYQTPAEGPPARRSRALNVPHITLGAPRPGVAHAVLAALGIRPAGYTNATLPAIRARLFQLDRAAKADSGDGPRGAWVLNREIAADILDPLTAQLVLFQAGAFRMPMDGLDSLTIRKMVGVPGAYWAAESTEIEGEDAKWATATLMLKELRAPTSWPNRWLRNLAPGAESMIRDQMVKAMRLKMEYSALFGTGSVPADGKSSGIEPLGVLRTPGVTVTAISPAATPDLDHLKNAQAALEDANVEESETWGWVSHPRTFRHFEYMVDTNGQPILRESWAEGVRARTLVDFPYFKTTGVPKNLGGSHNASVLFLGDWQELVVGMGMDVELVVSEHVDIKQNQTFVMGVAYVDTAVMYAEAFHAHTGVLG